MECDLRVSVIIPVGDEDGWRLCRRSLDNSIGILKQDCPVEFEVLPCFDLEHKGACLARNAGLAKVTGDWIAWVDCDDEVEPNWASEIADAIKEHPDANIIQFDATEVKNGKRRPLRYRYQGKVNGEQFAHELLRNDGMPAWLWARVFRRCLFEGLSFEGRVKHDYGMFLQLLPNIHSVWSIGKPLYRYNRHGKGLSNYAQGMDYCVAGRRFESLIADLPLDYHKDGYIGLTLTMADVARHSKCDNGSRQFVRKYLSYVLKDGKVPMRLKLKTILAAIGL